ncbi:hypothetical protein KRMM14A1259_30590 [Krasilnikovia sp. MM14-A1259]
MKLFKSPLRRSTAALAGTVLGLAGVMAFAAPASAHHPEVSGTPSCVKDDGTWTVAWTVTNSEYDLQGDITSVTAGPDGTFTGINIKDVLPKSGEGALSGTQTLTKDAAYASLTVGAHWIRNGNDINADKTGRVAKPTQKCAPSTPPTKPSTPPTKPAEPAEPAPVIEADCSTITIGFDNPKNGLEFTLHITTSKGEKRNTVFKPGDRKVEKFSATPGFQLKLSLSVKGYTTPAETVTYQLPENCKSNGNGGGLPVTGAAAGTIAAGAAALLAIGGVLFFLARRRKVKFTA